MAKATYKSALRSKKLIQEALLSLIMEKEVTKITVTDIVKKADINRSTFYAHYPDIRGIFESFEDQILSELGQILDDFNYDTFFENPSQFLLRINHFLEQDKTLYQCLISSSGAGQFLEKMQVFFLDRMLHSHTVPKNVLESVEFNIRIQFFASGIVGLYRQWFLGKLDCQFNDIPAEISKLLTVSF